MICTAKEEQFDSWGQKIFFLLRSTQMALGPTQLPVYWGLGALFLGIKQLGHEADY
jgi:hypothetical protein